MSFFSNNTINLFSTVFLGIMLEAIPFLLFGTLLSSVIEVFVSESFFEKYIPKNKFLAILLASLIGLVFPVCECAVIPVAARLIKKGVPLHFATTFVLAVPIINIPVILSTYYAFSGYLYILVLRLLCGFLISCTIGFLASLVKNRSSVLLAVNNPGDDNGERAVKSGCTCGHAHEHTHKHPHASHSTFGKKIAAVLEHTTSEFFGTGKYLLLGAFVTSIFQSVIHRSILAGLGSNGILATLVMTCFAYILSICSQTDAFIARSFISQFPPGALVGFMVIGAMIDLKNTAMLGRVIKKKYIVIFAVLVITLGFIASILINLF